MKKFLRTIKTRMGALVSRPEKLYLAVALPVVLGFALFTPPFHGPDEDMHFIRIYQVASGEVMPEVKEDIARAGSDLPSEVGDSISDAAYEPNIRGISSSKYEPQDAIGELNDNILNPTNTRFYDTTATYTYNPLTYLLYALSVLPITLLDGPPIIGMYVARIFMAVVTITIFYLSIKLFPARKLLVALIFLTPMLLFQQAVISVDGFSYAVLALFFAYVASVYYAKNVTKRDWWRIGVLVAILACVKPLLFLFSPLVLVLVKGRKDLVPAATTLLITAIIVGGWLMFLGFLYHDVSVVPTGVSANPDQQIASLRDRPLRALRVAWNTYTTSYGDDQLRSLIGTLGTVDVLLPLWVIFVFAGSLLVNTIVSNRVTFIKANPTIHGVKLALLLFLMLIYFVAVNASLYAAYAPVGFDIFYGVQGRYFIPLIFCIPLLMLGRGIRIGSKDEIKLNTLTAVFVVFCAVFSLFALFQRYYLYTP